MRSCQGTDRRLFNVRTFLRQRCRDRLTMQVSQQRRQRYRSSGGNPGNGTEMGVISLRRTGESRRVLCRPAGVLREGSNAVTVVAPAANRTTASSTSFACHYAHSVTARMPTCSGSPLRALGTSPYPASSAVRFASVDITDPLQRGGAPRQCAG